MPSASALRMAVASVRWTNLAGDSKHAAVVADHRRWLPPDSAPLAPGSRHRTLTYIDGRPVWEDQPIGPSDPIPD